MANNVVAYVGIDHFDHILYTARILLKLGIKVLVIDHSDTRSIQSCIPHPKGIDINLDIATYKKLDFTMSPLNEKMLTSYDDILIAYGFGKPELDISYCTRIVYVTDLFRYNHIRIKDYSLKYNLNTIQNKQLVIKDAVETKITTDIISERIGIRFSPDNITILFRDDKDYYNGLISHTNNNFYFSHTSKQLKRHLMQETGTLHPNLGSKQVAAACHRAGRS